MAKKNYQRTLVGRMRQVHRWLVQEYPTPHPTSLKLIRVDMRKKDVDDGGCERHGRELRIDVNINLPWKNAVDTLLHEYAHAMVWPHVHMEKYQLDHGVEWRNAYGILYEKYNDNDGAEESQYL